MKTFNQSTSQSFWTKVFRLETPLFIAFLFIIFFLQNGSDLMAGKYDDLISNLFVGYNPFLFFGSVIVSSFLCSIVIVACNREERIKEKELEQMI